MITTENTILKLSETEKMKAVIKIQTVMLKAVHDFMEKKEILQLMPIILSKFTDPLGPDPNSSVIKTGEIEYQDQTLQLTQSMILHKSIAIGKGIVKLYIISPNVRLESSHRRETGRHAFEFSQIDFEFKEAKMNDIFVFVEDLMRSAKSAVETLAESELKILGRDLPKWEGKFPIYTSHELIERYGEDWEELSSKEALTPYFVTCLKREFYDRLDRSRPDEHYLNYDLMLPEGFGEVLSGAEREYKYEEILERLEVDKMVDKYEDYIKLAKQGKIHPSAGGGVGVERFIRYLTGLPHVGDVQMFRRIPGEKVTY